MNGTEFRRAKREITLNLLKSGSRTTLVTLTAVLLSINAIGYTVPKVFAYYDLEGMKRAAPSIIEDLPDNCLRNVLYYGFRKSLEDYL